jgi:hypothetical protein
MKNLQTPYYQSEKTGTWKQQGLWFWWPISKISKWKKKSIFVSCTICDIEDRYQEKKIQYNRVLHFNINMRKPFLQVHT